MVLSWNSPIALGGLGVLILLVAVIIYSYLHRHKTQAPAPVSATAPEANYSGNPHGSVDSQTGVINSEMIYPTPKDSE
jgi:hypothetical protein